MVFFMLDSIVEVQSRPPIHEDGVGPDAKSVFIFDKDDDQVFNVDNKVCPLNP
jgi:hypothetical protein